MEKHIRQHSHHLHGDRDADQIKICVNLLKRLLDDEYNENVFRNHDKKWGDTKMDWVDVKDDEKYGRDIVQLNITRPNANTKTEKEQERKEFRRLSKRVEQMKQQAYQ